MLRDGRGRGRILLLLTLAACVPRARTQPSQRTDARPALADASFEVPAFDSGVLRGRCTVNAPWGARSWGFEGATFSRPFAHSIAAARFAASGHDAYLWGRDDSGEWGFVRWIQGSAWAESNCGPIPWRAFSPIDTHGRRVDVSFRVRRERSVLLRPGRDWVLFALNVWLASPLMGTPGDSLWGRKPLVMDLAVHHETSSPTGQLRHFEDAFAYHYQVTVGEAPAGTWARFDVPLSRHIAAAAREFQFPFEVQRTLQLTQVEFVIELRHAEGAARLDDFSLRAR